MHDAWLYDKEAVIMGLHGFCNGYLVVPQVIGEIYAAKLELYHHSFSGNSLVASYVVINFVD